MAAQTFLQALVGVGQYDISASSGEIQNLDRKVITREVPNFAGGGFMHRAAGLIDGAFKVAGWSDFASGTVGQQFSAASLGTQQLGYVATPGTAAGDPCVFTRGPLAALSLWGGKVGDASPFALEITPDTATVQGFVAAPSAARTATGTGSAVTATGPTASQRVYAALAVTAASGTTASCTVKIQSAPASNFASPTDRITFTAATAAGWQFSSTSVGEITDGYWRATWTISGATPSFTFAVLFGIAP